MFSNKTFLSASALLLSQASAAPTGVKVANTNGLGYATSTNLNPGIYRDGGGGGCVNGLCVVGFSDTTICNGVFQITGSTALTNLCKTVGGAMGMNSFAHNTFATFDTADRNSKPNSPSSLYDFGNHNGENGQLVGPVLGAVSAQEQAMGSKFAIWPNANMVPLSAGIGPNEVVGVFNALEVGGETLYNTMAKITVTDDVPNNANMPAERIVPQLFQKDENLYGTYGVMAGHGDNYLYLFARSGSGVGPSGIKVARVPQDCLTDKTKYEYWDGSTWSVTQPSTTDTKSNIISSSGFMDTGELFWSAHFGCYVHVCAAYGGFNIAYSDSLTGGWSEPQHLYSAQIPQEIKSGSSDNLMYSGHSYPDWDPSGKSLLLSWAVNEMWIQMATVQFA